MEIKWHKEGTSHYLAHSGRLMPGRWEGQPYVIYKLHLQISASLQNRNSNYTKHHFLMGLKSERIVLVQNSYSLHTIAENWAKLSSLKKGIQDFGKEWIIRNLPINNIHHPTCCVPLSSFATFLNLHFLVCHRGSRPWPVVSSTCASESNGEDGAGSYEGLWPPPPLPHQPEAAFYYWTCVLILRSSPLFFFFFSLFLILIFNFLNLLLFFLHLFLCLLFLLLFSPCS